MKLGKHTLTLFWGNVRLTKNKSFEYQVEPLERASDMCGRSLFGCTLELTHRKDHAGIDFTFSIAKLIWFNVNVHDNRHWNDTLGRWMKPEDYQ